MAPRDVHRVLVVDDSEAFARSLEGLLSARFPEVRCGRSVAEVQGALEGWHPDLVLLDVVLPDGSAGDVLDLLDRREPAPAVIAISGEAEPEQAFELARRGVRVFLPKPISLEGLERALREVMEGPPDVAPHLRQVVGHAPLKDVEERVREVMVDEALARSRDSRRGAARLLAISRQLLQHILRRARR
ncbi:MAG: response regulator [Myxococcaceae bacterium]